MATDVTPSSSGLDPAERWSQGREYAHDTQPGDVTLHIDASLPLPQSGNMNAWARTGDTTGEHILSLPQLGNMDAWVGTENAMGELSPWMQR